MDDIERLNKRLDREKQARKQAEAIAEEQKRELYQANLELQRLNEKLEKRVKRRTAELSAARDETLQSIKARSAAEDALLAAQGRLAHLLAASRVVIFSLEARPSYRRTFISENVRDFLGYEAHEVLDDPDFWSSRVHPDDFDGVWARFPTVFEAGYLTQEYRFRLRDGDYRWVCSDLQLVHDEDGPAGYLTMLANLEPPEFPAPIGILRRTSEPTLSEAIHDQIRSVTEAKGSGDLEELLYSGDVWDVK